MTQQLLDEQTERKTYGKKQKKVVMNENEWNPVKAF